MRFAVDVPNFGDFADPRVVADLARRAEAAGWDGLFVWDHVVHRKELRRTIADPWVLLTAAALATRRIRRRRGPGGIARTGRRDLVERVPVG
jgi:alkanesulfonate monooxygenase SsuD/methylene tetrahydromethanopterin reductase-like flavin-dependent oxidoreductase (luciferase family)